MGNGRRGIAVHDRVIRGRLAISPISGAISTGPLRVASCRVVSPSRRVAAADTKRERADLRWTTRTHGDGVFTSIYDEDAVSPRFRLENSTTGAGTVPALLRGTAWYHLTNTRREARAAPPPLLRPFVVQPNTDPPRRAHARRAYSGTSDARRSDKVDAMGSE